MPIRASSRLVIGSIIGLVILIIPVSGFQLGGPLIVSIGQFSQLTSALVGGTLALICAAIPMRRGEDVEPWIGLERWSWALIGCGLLLWGVGEALWRYYTSIHQSQFPSLADIGYASLPPFVFAGLLLQPSSGSGRRRLFIVVDSLISMGAFFAIAWFLLLGSLAMNSTVEDPLAKFLGLYYPITDTALLSCVVFLILRRQGQVYQANARRISLLIIGLGLCFFVTSDFIYNVQQNAGIYANNIDTWVDLGWPLGMLSIGLAAHLRRFLPRTSTEQIENRLRRQAQRAAVGPEQFIPYLLLLVLSGVLVFNVLSSDRGQLMLRPVLLLTTIGVIGLVIIRQLLTLLDNERLAQQRTMALEQLQMANQHIEVQAHMIMERNAALEAGLTHLKDVQTSMANGNLRVRARLTGGDLMPLAAGLNLMADRLMRLEQAEMYAQRLNSALAELSLAIERYRLGGPFIIPLACNDFPEINRLLLITGLREKAENFYPRYAAPPPIPSSDPNQGPITGPTSYQLRNSSPSWPE